MDKKAWIVVTICCVLLGMNFWSGSDKKKEEAKPTQQPVAAAPATPAPAQTDTPAKTEASAETAPEAAPAAAPQETPQPPVQPVAAVPVTPAPSIIATLESKDEDGNVVARYNFQDVGGSLRSVDMVGQAIDSTREELKADVSINGNAPQGVGTLMLGLNGNGAPAFDQTVYKYNAEKSKDDQVVLYGKAGNLTIVKTFTLKPLKQGDRTVRGNAYVLSINIAIQNNLGQPLSVRNWGIYGGATTPISKNEGQQFVSFVVEDDGDFEDEDAGTFSHWFSANEPYRTVTDCDRLEWVGLMNQYYASVLKPGADSACNTYFVAPCQLNLPVTGQKTQGLEIAIGLPDFVLPPAQADGKFGGVRTLSYEYFSGPKLNTMLSDMTDDFRKIDRVMDYGIFYIISYPMNWLINVFHSWFGNWGWAIVAMTFVVRAIIWPLYRKSYVSMKRMSQLQPQMKELKEKYPNDPQRVQMEMMGLYRKYGINPLGGCLPMLLQMPIFLSFFWVLQTAAELRGAEWLGWVHDLSLPDTVYELDVFGMFTLPINVLPFLMIASMYIMMNMSPQAPGGDKMQRVIMRIMPFFFFFFCYNYASALALYWTTTNIISMIQMLIIRRLPMPQLKEVQPSKKGGKKGFMQRMYEAQQAALKEQQRQAQMRNVTRK